MKLETIAISKLRKYAGNPRVHNGAQVTALARSIERFGFTVPVLIDQEGELIAGHGRLLAAEKLGLTEVPVLRAEHLTPEQVREYRLIDNRLSEMSTWDDELLAVEMAELDKLELDLTDFGFSDQWLRGELGDLWQDRGLEHEGDDLEQQAHATILPPVAIVGDVWICGPHRIACGDSTNAEHIERLLAGAVPHLMVTDPPYGVDYDPSWRNKVNVKRAARGRSKAWKVENDSRADWSPAWALFPGDVAYVWHGALHTHVVANSLEQAGFRLRSQIIWKKQHMVLSRGAYHWEHEPLWYAVREGGKAHWSTDRKQTSVWQITSHIGFVKGEGDDATVAHGTQKPIECMLRPMIHSSLEGDAVFDPFLGSGSTLIAAERSGRKCFASELDPRCVDVAVRRWMRRSGSKAVLELSRKGWREVEQERNGA